MKRCTQILLGIFALSLAAPAFAGTVKGDELRSLVEDHLRAKAENVGLEARVKKMDAVKDLTLPDGKVSYEVITPPGWEGYGPTSVTLLVRVEERVVRNLSIRADVEAFAPVVVASRQIEAGDILGASDVELQKRDLSSLPAKVGRRVDDVVGKKVRVAVRAGGPVRLDQTEKVPVVKSGQTVTIIVENDAMRLTATGRAAGSGAVGDTIHVQNLASQKIVSGRILDASTVLVDF